jgi:folate-binding Fe-S cluster repair protein YgfZ
MTHDATQALRATLLPHLAVLRAAGPDAVTFLQGQFTNDTRLLADGRTQLSSCSTSHGRVIAIMRLRQTDDAIYVLLPTELATRLLTHLGKFVLRAKVDLVHAHDLQVGTIAAGAALATAAGGGRRVLRRGSRAAPRLRHRARRHDPFY